MPKSQLVIGIVSQKGAGKGTAAEYLQREHGAAPIRFSALIQEMMKDLGLPPNKRTMISKFITKLREMLGKGVLAQMMVRKIQSSEESLFVLDGIRFVEEYEFLRDNLPRFAGIAIEASPKIRYLRTKKRGEKDGEANFTYSQFLSEQDLPSDCEIPQAMKLAKHQVNNDGELEEFHAQLEEIMKKLLK